jgi:hypothetical protein
MLAFDGETDKHCHHDDGRSRDERTGGAETVRHDLKRVRGGTGFTNTGV